MGAVGEEFEEANLLGGLEVKSLEVFVFGAEVVGEYSRMFWGLGAGGIG